MSCQETAYLAARADGLSIPDACFEADIPAGEAALIEEAIARGEIELNPPPLLQQPTGDGGCDDALDAGDGSGGCGIGGRQTTAVNPENVPNPPKENETMANKDEGEIKAPDFERMKKVFLKDIKPAEEKNAKSRGDLSAAWKVIEDECGLNKKAAKLLHKLNNESEETRDDFLRTLWGGMKALGLGISEDLVDQMEDSDAPEMPVRKRGLGTEGLATLNS